jgi:hypothetical protein
MSDYFVYTIAKQRQGELAAEPRQAALVRTARRERRQSCHGVRPAAVRGKVTAMLRPFAGGHARAPQRIDRIHAHAHASAPLQNSQGRPSAGAGAAWSPRGVPVLPAPATERPAATFAPTRAPTPLPLRLARKVNVMTLPFDPDLA